MPHTYLQDIKEIIDALSKDKGFILEEKHIRFGLANDYIEAVRKELEDDLATEEGLVQ